MDKIENKYLVLPIHTKVSEKDANYICRLINKYIQDFYFKEKFLRNDINN